MIDIEAERKAFESWLVKRWAGDRGELGRYPNDDNHYGGQYVNGHVEFAWQSRLERAMTDQSFGQWILSSDRVPAIGTHCVVLLRYDMVRQPFLAIDTWDTRRVDPNGADGPTSEGWDDNDENDVLAWMAIPPIPQGI